MHHEFEVKCAKAPETFFDFKEQPDQHVGFVLKKTGKAADLEKVLTKKLRWITLGMQYNWTDKTYDNGIFIPEMIMFSAMY